MNENKDSLIEIPYYLDLQQINDQFCFIYFELILFIKVTELPANREQKRDLETWKNSN